MEPVDDDKPPVDLTMVGSTSGWIVTASSSKGVVKMGPYPSMEDALRVFGQLQAKFKEDGRL